jgi:serine-type D-Ala-D-Ala carboxypeptidase (penicillin-binding protein 5/6)
MGRRLLVVLCAGALAIVLGWSEPAVAGAVPEPAPGARAAALIEESTGQQLYGRAAGAELAIASTTKLMTALVTLHHARLNQVFADPDYYPASVDSQIGLVPGERMSVHDLLIAMLLPSADDAAEDLAYNVGGGSVDRFLGMMNARARELGLEHTHYTTPIGLDTPGNYSTAADLVKLARFLLLTEPFFKKVVATPSVVLRTGDHVRVVPNLNDLVARVPWINGVKTGHTLEAGYVLVVSGTRNGMTLIGAVLGASSEAERDAAALSLLDYGFATCVLRTPVRAGRVIATRPVQNRPHGGVKLIAASAYRHVFPRVARIRTVVNAPAELAGPLPEHTVVGSVEIIEDGRDVASVPLELAQALPRIRHPKSQAVLVLSVTLSGLLIAAAGVLGLAMFWREWSRG